MSTQSDAELSRFRRQHIGRAIFRAQLAFQEEFDRRIFADGFEDYRASDVEIIARLPHSDGARITELAERSRVTKQAIGKLVRSLEERGYVARRVDPDDGRAQRVVLTPKGRTFLVEAQRVVKQIERDWKKTLGDNGLEDLREMLLKVANVHGPGEYL